MKIVQLTNGLLSLIFISWLSTSVASAESTCDSVAAANLVQKYIADEEFRKSDDGRMVFFAAFFGTLSNCENGKQLYDQLNGFYQERQKALFSKVLESNLTE